MEIETTLACPRISVNSEMSDIGGEDRPGPCRPGPVVSSCLWPARKRHPIPVRAFFQHSLVLTYAVPAHILAPLLPPGLVLDTFRDLGFIAIAMVQTKNLRPSPLPSFLGQDFFLSGYRIFSRLQARDGRSFRGLRILRSDTNSRAMAFFGNCLTRYNYQVARVRLTQERARLQIEVQTANAEADLHVIADIGSPALKLPEQSPFTSLDEARRYAGPLPFTFDYEPETNSIVMIEGLRRNWKPTPVRVDVLKNTFIKNPLFRGAEVVLANAFYVSNIPYRWNRGVLIKL